MMHFLERLWSILRGFVDVLVHIPGQGTDGDEVANSKAERHSSLEWKANNDAVQDLSVTSMKTRTSSKNIHLGTR